MLEGEEKKDVRKKNQGMESKLYIFPLRWHGKGKRGPLNLEWDFFFFFLMYTSCVDIFHIIVSHVSFFN